MIKRLITVCFLCSSAYASFPFTGPVNMTHNWSSYDSAQFTAPSYVLGGSYFATAFYLENNQYTNDIVSSGQSGSSWGGDITNNIEEQYQPQWAHWNVPGYNVFMATGNGGYQSNDVFITGTNIAGSTTRSFNGTGYTNQGISYSGVTHLFVGNPIEDGTSASNRNNGSLALNVKYATPTFDLYNQLRAFNDDPTNYYAGGHPHPSLSLIWAMFQLVSLDVDTNVATLSFKWNDATVVVTNHVAASSISASSTSLSATVKWDRMPMAWDVPDGTITNDARPAFVMLPSLGDRFKFTLQVSNIPAGTYTVSIDGSNVITCDSSLLSNGWNMFTNYNGALWAQRKEVLGRKRDQIGSDRVTLVAHNAGSVGTLGIGDMVNYGSIAFGSYSGGNRGSTHLTAVATALANVDAYNTNIWNATIQTNHTVVITKAGTSTLSPAPYVAIPKSKTYTISWNPGGYTNFVVLSTTNLSVHKDFWTVYGYTDRTNYLITNDAPYRFFGVIGICLDGNSAWATR